MVFGVISPKSSTKRVNTPVAAPTAWLPNTSVTSTVSMEDAERLTTLFPIRMAPSILLWSLLAFKTQAAALSPLSARFRIRIRFTVVRAVSEEEKNAESTRQTTTNTKRMTTVSPDRSKIHQLLFLLFIFYFYTGFKEFYTRSPSLVNKR